MIQEQDISGPAEDLRRVVLARCYELILGPDWDGNESESPIPTENGGKTNTRKRNVEGVKVGDGEDD